MPQIPPLPAPATSGPGRAAIGPTSMAQKRIIALRSRPGSTRAHIVANHLRVRGDLDLDRLKQAIRAVVQRHPILRTNYATGVDGSLVTIIHDRPANDIIEVVEPTGLDGEQDIIACVQRVFEKRFESFTAPDRHPMLRLVVVPHGAQDHSLLLMIDHIAVDERSRALLQRDIEAAYRGETLAEAPGYDPDNIKSEFPPVADIPELDAVFRPAAPRVLLSFDPRAEPGKFSPLTQGTELPRSFTDAVANAAKSLRCTRFVVYLAALFVAFKQFSGVDDIAIAGPVDTRVRSADFETMGFYQNIVLMRSKMEKTASVGDVIDECRSIVANAMVHREYPIAEIVTQVCDAEETARYCDPLCQVRFAYSAADVDHGWRLDGLEVRDVPLTPNYTSSEYTLYVSEHNDGLKIETVYTSGALSSENVARITELWTQAVGTICGANS